MDKKVFQQVSYGLYVVCAKTSDGKINGQIANAMFQVTCVDPTFAISICLDNLTNSYIKSGNAFTVSILNINTPMEFIANFGFNSGRDIDKFANVKYSEGLSGIPVIQENTTGYFECQVINSVEVGTHTIFIGKVTNAEMLNDNEVLTYTHYHLIKGGKAPKNAPTYVESDPEINVSTCNVCGHLYNPEEGDSKCNIPPGTAFEDLPDDWTCPICGSGKTDFS